MKFLTALLPDPKSRVVVLAIFAAFAVYGAVVPLYSGSMLFDLFHHAGRVFLPNVWAGDTAWEHLRRPEQNYFKMGPFFLVFPLSLLGLLPETFAHVLWQLMNFTAYVFGLHVFFNARLPARVPRGAGFAFLLALLVAWDLAINAQYNQVTGILVGGMLAGWGWTFSGRPIRAGIAFAFVTHMKLVPIIAVLLLATGFSLPFLLSFVLALAFFYLSPALLMGWTSYVEVLKGLVRVLSIDLGYAYGNEEVHHHYGIRAFLQSNFGKVYGPAFNVFPFLAGLVLGVASLLTFRKALEPRPSASREEDGIRASVVIATTAYILLFNTRTEGYSSLHWGPIYALVLLALSDAPRGRFRLVAGAVFALCVFTLSWSLTDVGRALGVNRFFWEHNLRTVACATFLAAGLLAFLLPSFRRRLLNHGEAP